jgi:tetratricopeptide (TPR) repeat protein
VKLMVILLPILISPAVAQSVDCKTLKQCEEILKATPNSSLAHCRVGELLFEQNNFQGAAVAFKDSLDGDLEPKWTRVWAHINLGKIYDLTRSRDRAVKEYQRAQNTHDDTGGAQAEAAKYLESPYRRE